MKKFVKTQRLAGFLMLNGFILLKKDVDRTNPKYDIYIFEHKEGFEQAIENYTRLYSNKK